MIVVDGGSIVLTERGLQPVRLLREGDKVATIASGQELFTPARVTASHSTPMHHVFSSAGDIILGSSSFLVTASGPMCVSDMWMRRLSADFGRMSGDIPPVETFSHFALAAKLRQGSPSRASALLLSALRTGVPQSETIRVRVPSSNSVRTHFSRSGVVIDRPVHTPGGWTWLRIPQRDSHLATHTLTQLAELVSAVVVKSSDLDAASLPIEDGPYRWAITECARLAGLGLTVTWSPAYAPSIATLECTRRASHAIEPLHSLAVTTSREPYGIALENRSAYLMLHGHLLRGEG